MTFNIRHSNKVIKNENESLVGFLGLKRNVVLLLVITLLIYSGEKLWERFLPKYFESIGATIMIIGGLGFLQNMLGSIWALKGGYLADKFGTRKSFFLFNILAIGGLLWMKSPELNFLSAASFGILGTVYFIFFGGKAHALVN